MKNFIEVTQTIDLDLRNSINIKQSIQVSAIENFYPKYEHSKLSGTRICFGNGYGYVDALESYQEVKDLIAKAINAQ